MRFPRLSLFAALSTLALLASGPATAAVHAGNPVLDLHLTVGAESLSSADVTIDDLVMVACDQTEHVIAIDDTVDLVGGFQQNIPAGDWCAVRLEGLSFAQVTGSGQAGSWVMTVDHSQVTFDIDPGDGALQLDQYTVVQGAVHAGNPVLDVFID